MKRRIARSWHEGFGKASVESKVFLLTAFAGSVASFSVMAYSVANREAAVALATAFIGVVLSLVWVVGSFDEVEADPKFCHDCGKRYVPFQRQSGFEVDTGKPDMRVEYGCPDWTDSGRAPALIGVGSLATYSTPDTPGRCGSRVRTPFVMKLDHTGHPEEQPDITCKACRTEMVKLGAISPEAAAKFD